VTAVSHSVAGVVVDLVREPVILAALRSIPMSTAMRAGAIHYLRMTGRINQVNRYPSTREMCLQRR
jgi:hypothetical protein